MTIVCRLPLWCLALVGHAAALVASPSIAEQLQFTRGRLVQAFSSPSGKLTLSPELVIPEPRDSTAILLQSNAIQTLSERVRASKANAAILQGSLTCLQTFCNEQQLAVGRFPGPVPTIYSLPQETADTKDTDNSASSIDISAIAASGADGVLIRVCGGKAIGSINDIMADAAFQSACTSALQCGIQPIPEVTVSPSMASTWSEGDFQNLIAACTQAMGDQEPVSIVLTVDSAPSEKEENSSNDVVTLPTIPKSLSKRIPILGSVRVTAGENRLGTETARFKAAGFHGAILKSDCVPGLRNSMMQGVDLNFVANFWHACITDLKSTKSKAFSFRSKNNLEKSVATQWGNYQRSVIESGALGDPNESSSVVDSANGDYQGF